MFSLNCMESIFCTVEIELLVGTFHRVLFIMMGRSVSLASAKK